MKTILALIIAAAADFLILSLLNYRTWDAGVQALAAVIGLASCFFIVSIIFNRMLAVSPERAVLRRLKEYEQYGVQKSGANYRGMGCSHCGALLTSQEDALNGILRTDNFDKVALKQGIVKCVHCGSILNF